jgi:methyl-accepting chemotaxis protein
MAQINSNSSFSVSISAKFAFLFTLFGVVITAVFYGVFEIFIFPQVVGNIKSRLADYAVVSANLVDKEAHLRITENNLTEDSVEYLNIKKTLQEVAVSNDRIDSIYTMVPTKDPNTLNFVVDSLAGADLNGNGVMDENETPATINEPYDITDLPSMRAGLSRISVEDTPFTDKWGTTLSAYAPLKTEAGKTIGLVGVDIRYETFLADLNDFRMRAYFIFGLLILLCMTLGYLMGIGVVRRLRSVVNDVRKMSEEDSDDYLAAEGSDEMAELLAMINEMVRRLREKKQDLRVEVEKQTVTLREKLEDLEKLNRLMVDRELRMIELKKKNKSNNE